MAEAGCPPGLLGDLHADELNDSCCWACSGGGDVVCCDGCRAVYHLVCLGLEELPEEEDWFCPLCTCKECQAPCRTRHPAASIQTQFIPARTKVLQPREYPHQRLPSDPGYVCPQQLRLWLSQQPTTELEQQDRPAAQQPAAEAAAAPGAPQDAVAAGGSEQQDAQFEPRPKRHKAGPTHSSSGSVSPRAPRGSSNSAAAATYVRCCCCHRACHVSCLGTSLRQQYMQPPPRPASPPPPPPAAAPAPGSGDGGKAAGRRSGARGRGGGARSTRTTRAQQQEKEEEEQEKEQQQQQQQQQPPPPPGQAGDWQPLPPYFCSSSCQHAALQLAQRCAQGLVQLEALADGTPVCWQLVQPAAVAAALAAPPEGGSPAPVGGATGGGSTGNAAEAPSGTAAAAGPAAAAAAADGGPPSSAAAALAGAFPRRTAPPAVPPAALLGSGAAPGYTCRQAGVLVQVLADVAALLSTQLGPALEVRTFQDGLPWLLAGLRQATPGGGLLDLSHFHVAVLWVGSTLGAAALLRLHGGGNGGLLEVAAVATSPLLQHLRLGRCLAAAVERFALHHARVAHAWMPALGGVVRPCVGVSLLPAWERPGGARERLQLAPGCSVLLLGLQDSGSSSGGRRGGRRQRPSEGGAQQQQQQQQQKVLRGVEACWALKLGYGKAANLQEWLQLTRHPLLRYSYVPFVCKQLEQHSLLPMPHFRRHLPARPPPLPPLQPVLPVQQQEPQPEPQQGAPGTAPVMEAGLATGQQQQQQQLEQQQQRQQQEGQDHQMQEAGQPEQPQPLPHDEPPAQQPQPALQPLPPGTQQPQQGQQGQVSKRQLWKDQVMQQFLAQQAAPAPDGAAAAAPASQPVQVPSEQP